MRYYKIVIVDFNSTSSAVTSSTASTQSLEVKAKPPRIYTSLTDDGKHNPAALSINFDLPIAAITTAMPGGHLQIQGIPITEVSQATNLQGRAIKIYGGMSAGLPLANPNQAGLLLTGQVFQSWGNWLGNQMAIDMIIMPLPPTDAEDLHVPVVLNWPAGQTMADAIKASLKAAYPNAPVDIAIKDTLVLNHTETGYYNNLGQFSELMNGLSKSIIADKAYLGVQITHRDGSFSVLDGSKTGATTAIVFTDLIGQPTWVDQGNVQVQVVLRARLAIGDQITLPAAVTDGYGAIPGHFTGPAPARKSIFSGTFTIIKLRHLGDSRNPDGGAWVTVIDAVPNTPPVVAKAA